MNLMKNTLIKASAGTGKTFTLATRMIRMLLLGEEPSSIVALTFSRAAAGEIFSKLAERLALAASSENGAETESETLFKDMTPELANRIQELHNVPLSRTCFTGLLRRVIASQHLSMISTLDSFMFRMVQSFPLELGFQNSTAIMDEFEKAHRIQRAVSGVLHSRSKEKDSTEFIETFRLAAFGKESRNYFQSMIGFIEKWHNLFNEFPTPGMWGGEQILSGSNAPAIHRGMDELASELRSCIGADWRGEEKREANWNSFCDFIRDFNYTIPTSPAIIKNILGAWESGSSQDAISIRNDRKLFDFSGADARLINEAAEAVYALLLQACIRTTQGIFRIIKEFEDVYNRETRRQGMMTFSDIPGLISTLDESIRRNIEYRFDNRFRHWALDEFQDTSWAQWNAVRNLVDEVIQSTEGDRSIFIVGDVKQAIYGWRGGDVGIFDHEATSGCYSLIDLSRSYRYCPEIAELVNIVFDGESIMQWLNNRADGAGEMWQHYWEPHRSEQPSGYVEVERAFEKRDDEKSIDGYIRRAASLLLSRRPWESGIRTAVLVRGNDHGKCFAEAFKAQGIPTVWEGENFINDTPVVNALLNTLAIAEHPGDTLAWHHICASPLAQILFSEECSAGDETGAARISERVLSDVARNGLERTLQQYVNALDPTLNEFSRSRLNDLIRAAAGFTEHYDEEAMLTDFITYTKQFTNRDISGASTVRIQTIHRSKGLGFDYVILPILEKSGITTTGRCETISAPDKSWLIKTPLKMVCERQPDLNDAMQHVVDTGTFEELCVLYVAMTRAKQAMSVIVKPPARSRSKSKEPPLYFGEYIVSRLGNDLPWHSGKISWAKGSSTETEATAALPELSIKRKCRHAQARVTPSTTVIHGMNAGVLFSSSESGAMLKGTRIHEELSRIEWLEPPFKQPEGIDSTEVDLSSESTLRDALTKPVEATDLWRERSFEIILNKRWVSGTFDRVVFNGSGESLIVEIMDFKTNRMRSDESEESFHLRMIKTYKTQMELYRGALEQLAGIPAGRIKTKLLLTETRECISI